MTTLQRFSNQKGVSIFLAVVLMTLFLSMVLGLSAILLSQIRIIQEGGDSVIAFFAADTGAERAIYEDRVVCKQEACPGYCSEDCSGLPTGYELSETLGNNSSFLFKIFSDKMQSVGIFKGVRRAVEITR